MTISQLEYLIAVHTYGSFVVAAEHCFVTQPTLSMQIQKLEESLGVKLLDRSKQPVIATEVGKEVIAIARNIIQQTATIKDIIADKKGEVAGVLKLGIIPTLAPYLLPLFVNHFCGLYPKVKLIINELTTDEIIKSLKNETIDCGLLVTPLEEKLLKETILFYEPFVTYLSPENPLLAKKNIEASDLNVAHVWVLKEGHCFRNQVLNICSHVNNFVQNRQVEYASGSLQTLMQMVELGEGLTILPELAIWSVSENQMDRVRYFSDPQPVREVSLVTHRDYYKKNIIDALVLSIKENIPAKMKSESKRNVVSIH